MLPKIAQDGGQQRKVGDQSTHAFVKVRQQTADDAKKSEDIKMKKAKLNETDTFLDDRKIKILTNNSESRSSASP